MSGLTKKPVILFLSFISAIVYIALSGTDAIAAESISRGRVIWNNIMLWVNFGILVFVFIKFGKKPLLDLLQGERQKIGKRIEEIEEKVKEARSLMEEESDRLKNIDEHIAQIREQIIELGNREKENIIEKAKITADLMIEDAQKEAQYRVEVAKKHFSEEMLDIAISIAVEQLRHGLNQEDNDKIVNNFSGELAAAKQFFH